MPTGASGQSAAFSAEKLIKPGVEPAKEFDIHNFESQKVNGLAKTTNRAYGPCDNAFGVGLQVRTPSSGAPDNGTFFTVPVPATEELIMVQSPLVLIAI